MNTVDALVQLSFRIQRILSDTGGEHDLSLVQMRLLGVLRDRQAGMLELAAHLGLDKSSMTGLVGRAEKRGLVRRAPSPHDGRAVVVTLTAHGHDLAARCTAEIAGRVTAFTEPLPQDQRTALTRLATALLSADARSAGS
ncbi:MarR family transcriptional regulator [Streptomyces mangrovisoli]|uniref:MarR family transcriptional regulator n=1 Tax=Streptomyces mangrovisoli TaxID=1428628 RepID=A0A1J4NVV5_9ACTN|nr:MarR family transcriptional regulator [Streptomyces mangrovisoli]